MLPACLQEFGNRPFGRGARRKGEFHDDIACKADIVKELSQFLIIDVALAQGRGSVATRVVVPQVDHLDPFGMLLDERVRVDTTHPEPIQIGVEGENVRFHVFKY